MTEVSDYSKRFKRAEWRSIPDFLFTCDVTKRFEILSTDDQGILTFDVVTSWEFMEHIRKEDIGNVIENASRHLKRGGIWIMSIANFSHIVNGVDLHQTREPKSWWLSQFEKCGLFNSAEILKYFNGQFVRGRYETETSFHLVLTNDLSRCPKPPKLRQLDRIVDKWINSFPQRALSYLVTGKLD